MVHWAHPVAEGETPADFINAQARGMGIFLADSLGDALAPVVGIQHGSVHCKHVSIESYASSVGGQLTDARAEGSS